MKKLSFLTALIFSSLTLIPAAAEKKVINAFQLSVPLSFHGCELSSDHSRKYLDAPNSFNSDFFGVSGNWNFMLIAEGGTTFICGLEAGCSFMKTDQPSVTYLPVSPLNRLSGKAGIGYAPFVTEKYALMFHGFASLDFALFEYETKYGTGPQRSDLDYTVVDINLHAGIDIVYLLKLSDKMSLFAGVDISKIVLGGGRITARRDNFDAEEEIYGYTAEGTSFIPRFGIALGF